MIEQQLAGRHVVVTGETVALGNVVVDRLLEAGMICHVPNHRSDGGASAGHDRLHMAAGVDLTDDAAVHGFYGAIPDLWAAVHLAGGFAMAQVTATSRADVVRMIEMNALTTFLSCRAAVENMRKTGLGGRIVNVAARAALEPRK